MSSEPRIKPPVELSKAYFRALLRSTYGPTWVALKSAVSFDIERKFKSAREQILTFDNTHLPKMRIIFVHP